MIANQVYIVIAKYSNGDEWVVCSFSNEKAASEHVDNLNHNVAMTTQKRKEYEAITRQVADIRGMVDAMKSSIADYCGAETCLSMLNQFHNDISAVLRLTTVNVLGYYDPRSSRGNDLPKFYYKTNDLRDEAPLPANSSMGGVAMVFSREAP